MSQGNQKKGSQFFYSGTNSFSQTKAATAGNASFHVQNLACLPACLLTWVAYPTYLPTHPYLRTVPPYPDTYLVTCQPTRLLTFSPTHLITQLPAHLLIHLPTDRIVPTYLLACLLTYLLGYLLTFLTHWPPSDLLTQLRTYIRTCLRTYLRAYLRRLLPPYPLSCLPPYARAHRLLTYLRTHPLAFLLACPL